MRIFALVLAAVFICSLSASAQNNSVYTRTSERICKEKKFGPDEGGDYLAICPGVGGYKIELIEGDLRQTIAVITPANQYHRLDLTRFYMTFSAVGDKIEWRTKKGVPVALIVRYNVADGEVLGKRTSYMIVAKVNKTASCVTDVVMPGPRQNEEARKLADLAATRPCKLSEE